MKLKYAVLLFAIVLPSWIGRAEEPVTPTPPDAAKAVTPSQGSVGDPGARGTDAAGEGTASPSEAAAAPPSLSYELRIGQGVFRHYCQTCHGETGAGDGFNAFNLDPHPRDLSDPAFQKSKSDADLSDAIRRGGAGVGLSALMPPWGHTLSAQQTDAVIHYLRSLRKAPPR